MVVAPLKVCRLNHVSRSVDLGPDHILYGLLSGSSDARQNERLRFKSPFVPAVRNLLNNLAGLGIRASEWKDYR